jgi:putative ABC transport system substrate-binding protein
MRRREFILLLGGAVAWPFVARAEQSAMPVVGFLRSTSLAAAPQLVAAFRKGLNEAGFVQGQSVRIEFRSAEDHADRLPGLAAELVRWPVSVIVGDNIAARAAMSATKMIPIVYGGGGDPVKEGLVASLNRPGGNVTGVNFFTGVLGTKRLELLRPFARKAATIAVLIYPNTTQTEAERVDLQTAAHAMGQQLVIRDVSSENDIDVAFAAFVARGAGALLVGSGPFLFSHRERVVALTARHVLPTIFSNRDAAVAGGLMSYGPNVNDAFHQVGLYTGRILKGEKPADLPVMQAVKFEFVINLKTAKSLGVDVPPTLLALADEVIE